MAIVISYRRADSQAITGRIFDRLENHFGAGSVFMDIDNIPLGADFREHITDTLTRCDVLLAIVGPHWLDGPAGNRLSEETDWVRIEIEAALAKKIPVIPVLIDHVQMPAPNALPESLRNFAFRQGITVDSGIDFRPHMDRLIRSLDQHLDKTRKAREAGAQRGAPAPAQRDSSVVDFPKPAAIPDVGQKVRHSIRATVDSSATTTLPKTPFRDQKAQTTRVPDPAADTEPSTAGKSFTEAAAISSEDSDSGIHEPAISLADVLGRSKPAAVVAAIERNRTGFLAAVSERIMVGGGVTVTLLVATLLIWLASPPSPRPPAEASVPQGCTDASQCEPTSAEVAEAKDEVAPPTPSSSSALAHAEASGAKAEPNVAPLPSSTNPRSAPSATDGEQTASIETITRPNDEKFAALKRSAEAGDPIAEDTLGTVYKYGQGVPRDYSQALAWYQKSAAHGNSDAAYNIAVMYQIGEGVAQDDAKARAWFQKSAQLNGEKR